MAFKTIAIAGDGTSQEVLTNSDDVEGVIVSLIAYNDSDADEVLQVKVDGNVVVKDTVATGSKYRLEDKINVPKSLKLEVEMATDVNVTVGYYEQSIDAGAAMSVVQQAVADSKASADASEASAVNSLASEELSAKYATEAEDTEVETDKYSALHWSAKSEAFAAASEASKNEASDIRNEITSLKATAVTISEDEVAIAHYDAEDGVITFGIPQGPQGDPYTVNATGPVSEKTDYNGELKGFGFLSTDEDPMLLYIKLSDDDEDNWSDGQEFGKGAKGDTGATGLGIKSIDFKETTDDSGDPAQVGATDTYTITLDDDSTVDYDVANGVDHQEVIDKCTSALGITDELVRYDKKLESLNVVEMKYDDDDNLTTVRYTDDGDTDAPYYRDEFEYDDDGNLVKVSHYYNTNDLDTASGTTDLSYDAGKLISTNYSE